MVSSRGREVDQLFLVASHYLVQAKRLSRRLVNLNRSLHEVTDNHALGKLRREELLLAHLASCAIRLCTICEKTKGKLPYKKSKAFYEGGRKRRIGGMSKDQIKAQITQNLDEHIHFLLRDNVGHEENVESDMAIDRFDILMSLTIGQALAALVSLAKSIRRVI